MLKTNLLKVARIYAEANTISLSRTSTLVFGDGQKIANLETGSTLTVERFHSAMMWFREKWPKDLPWPSLAWPDYIVPPVAATAVPS